MAPLKRDRNTFEQGQNVLPPRWVKCPRKGTLICNLFLPFKTPLDEKFDYKLDPGDMFHPSMVLTSQNKIGLWIDLTKTSRFYDKSLVESHCEYVKLPCEGHAEAPNDEAVECFGSLCDRFRQSNPDARIGVHCTHGFNRTGYLICVYLVTRFGIGVVDAINHFALCRPPGIYKQDYLKTLFIKFNPDASSCPTAPPYPEWDNDHEEGGDKDIPALETVNSQSTSSSNSNVVAVPEKKRFKKEIEKKDAVFCPGIDSVKQVTDAATVKRVREKVQKMCGWERGGFPGLQPVSLELEHLECLRKDHYRVSWKADGLRYLLLIDGKEEIYFLDRDNTVFHAPQFTFPLRKKPDVPLSNTLVDGELVIDEVGNENFYRFLAYDIIQFMEDKVGKMPYDIRLVCIDKEIVSTRSKSMEEGAIDRKSEPFSIRCKPFYDITNTRKLLTSHDLTSHERDGLIFQRYNAEYVGGTNHDVLKWKPPHLCTVDFKMKKVSHMKEGHPMKHYIELYVTGYPQPFGYLLKDLKTWKEVSVLPDNSIIECGPLTEEDMEKRETGLEKWKFLRHRTDKSTPNYIATAQSVLRTILRPVTEEVLLNFIDSEAKKPSPKPALFGSHSS